MHTTPARGQVMSHVAQTISATLLLIKFRTSTKERIKMIQRKWRSWRTESNLRLTWTGFGQKWFVKKSIKNVQLW